MVVCSHNCVCSHIPSLLAGPTDLTIYYWLAPLLVANVNYNLTRPCQSYSLGLMGLRAQYCSQYISNIQDQHHIIDTCTSGRNIFGNSDCGGCRLQALFQHPSHVMMMTTKKCNYVNIWLLWGDWYPPVIGVVISQEVNRWRGRGRGWPLLGGEYWDISIPGHHYTIPPLPDYRSTQSLLLVSWGAEEHDHTMWRLDGFRSFSSNVIIRLGCQSQSEILTSSLSSTGRLLDDQWIKQMWPLTPHTSHLSCSWAHRCIF